MEYKNLVKKCLIFVEILSFIADQSRSIKRLRLVNLIIPTSNCCKCCKTVTYVRTWPNVAHSSLNPSYSSMISQLGLTLDYKALVIARDAQ